MCVCVCLSTHTRLLCSSELGLCGDVQGVAQLLCHLTPLVQQGNLVEQLEDVIDDKTKNEVSSCRPDKRHDITWNRQHLLHASPL